MSRGFPKFLYSKVENAVDNGHFVVHTVYPKALFTVGKNDDDSFYAIVLEVWETGDKKIKAEFEPTTIDKSLFKWLKSQKHIVW